jgi:pimeloyl-ACP methyl ester carboxylesterase
VYYDTFLSSIHSTAPLYWEIIGLGHVAQSPDHPPSAREALKATNSPLPTLQDQIDSKIEFLDSLRAQFSSDTKVVLIGHSVGAYICQEITKRRPNMIYRMYGLFPSLAHIGETPNGKA